MARNYLLLRQILSPSPNYFCFCARNLFLFLCLPLHILNIANISIKVNNSFVQYALCYLQHNALKQIQNDYNLLLSFLQQIQFGALSTLFRPKTRICCNYLKNSNFPIMLIIKNFNYKQDHFRTFFKQHPC